MPRPSGTIQDMQIQFVVIIALLLSAVELTIALVIFRVVPDYWKENPRSAIAYAFIWLVIFNAGLIALLASGWLTDPSNSSALQVIAPAAQALFAAILIGLTVRTVQANAEVAQETRLMARETERMAEVAVEQQRAVTRPVLACRIHPSEGQTATGANEFVIESFNVGAGPALDARVSYTGLFNFAEPKYYVQPCTIAAGEAATFTFKIDKDSPMRDSSDPLKWPRTPEDAELIRESNALRDVPAALLKGSPENERRGVVGRERQHRSNQYYAGLTGRIAEQRDIGQIRADYRDLSGAVHVSTAALVVINPESRRAVEQKADELAELSGHDIWSFSPYWPDLMLGPLSVASPPTSPGNEDGATEAAP
jgi:hypothetical protein